jgi:hypothetical protein
MRRVREESEMELAASAAKLHALLTDYRRTRAWLLPPALRDHGLSVLAGGVGAGTIYRHMVHLAWREVTVRVEVTEPVPGSVVVEVSQDLPLTTTWTLTPTWSGSRTRVRLETEWTPQRSPSSFVERLIVPRQLRSTHWYALRALSELTGADRNPDS